MYLVRKVIDQWQNSYIKAKQRSDVQAKTNPTFSSSVMCYQPKDSAFHNGEGGLVFVLLKRISQEIHSVEGIICKARGGIPGAYMQYIYFFTGPRKMGRLCHDQGFPFLSLCMPHLYFSCLCMVIRMLIIGFGIKYYA